MDSPPSAYAFRAYPSAYFQGLQTAVIQGVIQFDLYPQKRGSKCVEIGMKKPRQKADTPALLSWLMLNCETVLSHKRACSPSCGTRRNRTPASRLYGFCGSDKALDNPCCYLVSLLSASVPFPSGGFAAHP